jgi:hypothetical protein
VGYDRELCGTQRDVREEKRLAGEGDRDRKKKPGSVGLHSATAGAGAGARLLLQTGQCLPGFSTTGSSLPAGCIVTYQALFRQAQ